MGDRTGIAWTDATWNPIRGCSVLSEGCTNCYAMRQAARWNGPGQTYAGLTRQTSRGPRWTGKITTVPGVLMQPLRWTRPRRIFVNSMSDLFHESVPPLFAADVFAVMGLASWHSFQVLTKRPARARALLASPDFLFEVQARAIRFAEGFNRGRRRRRDEVGDGTVLGWPLPNVWVGVSVENQAAADERVPELLRIPAALRFLSCEPLLGAVDLDLWMDSHSIREDGEHRLLCVGCLVEKGNGAAIDWVIAGGESGPGARLCELGWLASILAQCRAAEVPCFIKQLGSYPGFREADVFHIPEGYRTAWHPPISVQLRSRAGSDPSEWPEDLRVQELPWSPR